ncbi:MAG: hypothetical protein WAM66_02380 [Acidobacteriaceae bacterium]
MKELTAIFQSEIFRPLVTLVLPGCAAISTGSIALENHFPKLGNLVVTYAWPSAAIILLVVIALGLIAEDLGARLERSFDLKLAKEDGYQQHMQEWRDYLRLAFAREPVGHGYLKTLVLRLKFELGMAVASIAAALGAWGIHTACVWRAGIFVAALAVGCYFRFEAKCSVKGLSDLRRELLKKTRNEDSHPLDFERQPVDL